MSVRKAFTLIELLVVIAIIAVLASIIFPVFAQAKTAAKASVCLSNAKQVGIAMALYVMDNDDSFPMDSHVGMKNAWINTIQPYTRSRLLTRCPTDTSANFDTPLPKATVIRPTTFATNYWFSEQNEGDPSPLRGYTREGMITTPASTIYMGELAKNLVREHFHPGLWYPNNEEGLTMDPLKELWTTMHAGRSHYLFADWHAKAETFSKTFSGDGTVDMYDPRR